MIKWKWPAILFISVFTCVVLASYVIQKKVIPKDEPVQIKMSVVFDEDSNLNTSIVRSLNLVGLLCLRAELHDCERNFIPLRQLFDGYMPRSPTSNPLLEQYFANLTVSSTLTSMDIFDFEFSGGKQNIQTEDFYLKLLNDTLEDRLAAEFSRRKKALLREIELRIKSEEMIGDQASINKIKPRLQKAEKIINTEFEKISNMFAAQETNYFLTKKQMKISSGDVVVTEDITLAQRILKSLLISIVLTLYLWSFYVYYRKRG